LLGKLGEKFSLTELDGREALKEFMDREQSSYAYGVVLPGRVVGIVLKGRAEDVLEASCPEAMQRLGLVVLHDAVLGGMLGITREAMASQSYLVYRKDEGEVFRAVEAGEAQVGFVVHPTTVRQVLDVSDSGEVMPQKSTFFYPKIMTGLVFHSLG